MNRRNAIRSMVTAGAGALAAGSGAMSVNAGEQPKAGFNFKPYSAKTFSFDGIRGIDKGTLEEHYGLYNGYVNNVNKAQTLLSELAGADKAGSYEFNETRRRLGFEYAGMRLHEYYFGAMKPGGSAVDDTLKKAVSEVWGSWDAWIEDIKRTSLMRGIGWAILFRDEMTGGLQNFWITDHENGHPPGFKPVFVVDVWEHAYVKQFGAAGRKGYVEALFGNIDWKAVAKRLG